jgi:hypothetical protein
MCHKDWSKKLIFLNMEKTGLETVRWESTVPAAGISSNGMRMPEKKICGMNIIGRKLMAMFTLREKTLMVRPSSDPAAHAVHRRTPLLKLTLKFAKRKCMHIPNASA